MPCRAARFLRSFYVSTKDTKTRLKVREQTVNAMSRLISCLLRRSWRRPVRGTLPSAYRVLRAATKRLVEEIQALQNLEARTHCIRWRKEEWYERGLPSDSNFTLRFSLFFSRDLLAGNALCDRSSMRHIHTCTRLRSLRMVLIWPIRRLRCTADGIPSTRNL